jgi:hypothetical protein
MPVISTIPDAISKVTGRTLDQAQLRRRVGGGCQPASDVTLFHPIRGYYPRLKRTWIDEPLIRAADSENADQ